MIPIFEADTVIISVIEKLRDLDQPICQLTEHGT